MASKPGYSIGRDARGLTARERDVLRGLVAGQTQHEISVTLDMTKQRVGQLVQSLTQKGVIEFTDKGKAYVKVEVYV